MDSHHIILIGQKHSWCNTFGPVTFAKWSFLIFTSRHPSDCPPAVLGDDEAVT